MQVSENLRTFARSTIGDGIEKVVVYLQQERYLLTIKHKTYNYGFNRRNDKRPSSDNRRRN